MQKWTSRTMGPGLRSDSQPREALLPILLGSHWTLPIPVRSIYARSGTYSWHILSVRSTKSPKFHTDA